jgi:4-amino-4-deoxy-L-arabinose transferase-like glycosyltransferase
MKASFMLAAGGDPRARDAMISSAPTVSAARPAPTENGAGRPGPGLRTVALAYFVTFALTLPFSGRAFHVDDAFFIDAARGVLAHPLRPYAGTAALDDIDYRVFARLGEAPTTFVALSHPPLVPYVIAAVAATAGGIGERTQHLAFAFFALLATWAQHRLARRFTAAPLSATLALVVSSAFVLGAQSLMTDVPALALTLAALALFVAGVDQDDAGVVTSAGLVGGLAIVTRYVAFALVPVAAAYVFLSPGRRRGRATWALLAVGLVVGAWFLQNWIEHGALHIAASAHHYAQYYDRARGAGALFARNALYDLAALGMAAFPAVVFFLLTQPPRRAAVSLAICVAMAVGVRAARPCGLVDLALYTPGQTVALVAAVALGLFLVVEAVRAAIRGTNDVRFLALWFVGSLLGTVFLLPFGAVRYVLPAVPPVILIAAGGEVFAARAGGTAVRLALAGTAAASLALAVADYGFAAVYRNVAARVPALAAGRRVFFVGDWGFRYYMEDVGGRYLLSSDESPTAGALVIRPRIAGLHEIAPGLRARLTLVETIEAPGRVPVRLLSFAERAGFYSQHWGLLPFAFSSEPLERFDVFRVAS